MNGIASGMSEDEMKQASEWFAALKPRDLAVLCTRAFGINI